ncbi:MAG TPA: hypothetical protein VGK73_33590 [Polyangiaceae bacterium]
MTPLEILVLIAAIALVVAIAFGMTRWSQRKYADLRRVVAASDAAMRETASRLGLGFVAHGSYEHPIVGSVPAFGMLRGTLDGIHVEARVAIDHDAQFARTELSARTLDAGHGSAAGVLSANERYDLEREGNLVTLRPKVPRAGSSQFMVYEVVTDPMLLQALLRELAAIACDSRWMSGDVDISRGRS